MLLQNIATASLFEIAPRQARLNKPVNITTLNRAIIKQRNNLELSYRRLFQIQYFSFYSSYYTQINPNQIRPALFSVNPLQYATFLLFLHIRL